MADKSSTNSGIVYNMLAVGSKIKGDFIADSNFRIDGTFEGNIQCSGKVIVGETGNVIGNLICSTAEIMGTVEGTLTISELLSLKSTAKVTGDIKTKILSIEPKAYFSGNCDMSNEKTNPEK
ncbi:MAG: polymer-forming cytoskeletal protein [Paludibacteraceae bacterium]|nr:polymer-forming cytoskeletal protein [Paludibacteraceae bacterium]